MPVQTFLIHPRDNEDDNAREVLATVIAQHGGFILMATSHGSLITAFDDQYIETIRAHPLVEFASGVTLDPNAPGAAALQRMFAENVAAQLVERGLVTRNPMHPEQESPSPSPELPPFYKPMRWSTQRDQAAEDESQ
jgi:hypothetical protein